ncbi:MAG: hypothetical protein ACO32I_01255 [Candidatus Limnocylindrus sp.]
MSPRYISVKDDKFSARTKQGSTSEASTEARGLQDPKKHRRPLNGLEIFEDTHATITVRSASGKPLDLLNSGGLLQDSFTSSFIVQSVSESREEKQQMVPTFGDDYAYYFGQRPRMLTVSALLPHAENFQWQQEFWTNYDKLFRGTQLVSKDARVYFHVDRQVFEGYILTANTSLSADNPHIIPLQFTMHVTASSYIDALRNGPKLVVGSQESGSGYSTKISNIFGSSTSLMKRPRVPYSDVFGRFYITRYTSDYVKNTVYLLNRPHDYVVPTITAAEVVERQADVEALTPRTMTSSGATKEDLVTAFDTPMIPARTPRPQTQSATGELAIDTNISTGIVGQLFQALNSRPAQYAVLTAATAVGLSSILADTAEQFNTIAGDTEGFWARVKKVSGYLLDSAIDAVTEPFVDVYLGTKEDITRAGYAFVGAKRDVDYSGDVVIGAESVRVSNASVPQSSSIDSTTTGLAGPDAEDVAFEGGLPAAADLVL